jgi:excisionase family DNA binding protein
MLLQIFIDFSTIAQFFPYVSNALNPNIILPAIPELHVKGDLLPVESMLSISEASQMLGVSETALRQWTDEGKIKAFITPGGHRRYYKAELRKFMVSQPRTLGTKDLVTELKETALQHGEIDRASLKKVDWYNKLDQETRERLAGLGRRLLECIIRCMIKPSGREENLCLIRDAGHDMGETLAKAGIPLTHAVEGFLRHRDPIVGAAMRLRRRREAFAVRIVHAIRLSTSVMDDALVALVSAYQQCNSGISKNKRRKRA